MALFPGPPSDALSAALEMQTSVKSFNDVRALSKKQAIQIGIGIHTGPLMLGTIGEEGRYEGTVIADAVNLAARIEKPDQRLWYSNSCQRGRYSKPE